MNRRTFGKAALLTLLTQRLAQAAAPADPAEPGHAEAMAYAAFADGPLLRIGLLVYPGMFLQDLVGPLAVFESLMNREIHLLWKETGPLPDDGPTPLIPVRATTAFRDCPAELDVLFVPGGVPGTFRMMEDPEVLAFLAERGRTARYVTSVCTGSLILGAAGLLRGYRATTYWSLREVLRELGAEPAPGRVVIDRNRITGGGVTAGIDFGLHLAARLRSPAYAEAIQLYLEYDPQPPFDAGSPEKAPAAVKGFLDEMFVGMRETATATAQRARGRWAEGD